MIYNFHAPHRIWLYQNFNEHAYHTGGWKYNTETSKADEEKICTALFVPNVFHKSWGLPQDVRGNLLLYLKASRLTSNTQIISIRTAKMIDFQRLKWLRFLFTRDNLGRKENIFTKSAQVRVLDKNFKVLRVWDAANKNCVRERGEINIDGIREGYIEILLSASLKTGLSRIKTNDLKFIRTKNQEYIAASGVLDITSSQFQPQYIKTKNNSYVLTNTGDRNRKIMCRSTFNFNVLFMIYDMWIE